VTRDSSPVQKVQIVSGAHPASFSMGTAGPFPGVKRSEHEVDHSPSSAEVKNEWSYNHTPHTPFITLTSP